MLTKEFQYTNENSVYPAKNKHEKWVATINENSSTSSRANARKKYKTCDSINSGDESEANAGSDFVEEGNKRKILLTLQQK